MLVIIFLAATGFIVSIYTYLTEQKLKKVPSYKPICDLSDKVSCSKPLQSQYAHLFFISNSLAGMIFYAIIALLAIYNAIIPLLIMAILGGIVTFFLIYVLFAKIKSFCLVCIMVYIINILILIFAIF
jgi:vitamin-K-epoxide reductase (warfarin-sensitive)